MNESPTKTSAFVQGGCGCVLAFGAFAVLALAMGGRAHADPGGILILFAIGGVLGLIVRAIYVRGRRDGRGEG